jgi:hypothetical protein
MKKLMYLTVLIILSSCTQQDGYELFREPITPQYTYEFVVKVGDKLEGRIDSVEITINGRYYHQEIPFYYGSNNLPENYKVISNPDFIGICRTQVEVKGVRIDRFTHQDGNTGVLSGKTE